MHITASKQPTHTFVSWSVFGIGEDDSIWQYVFSYILSEAAGIVARYVEYL